MSDKIIESKSLDDLMFIGENYLNTKQWDVEKAIHVVGFFNIRFRLVLKGK